MNGFDIFCIVTILVGALVGFFRGLVYQLATMAALVASFFLAMPLTERFKGLADGSDILTEIQTYYLMRILFTGVLYFVLAIFIWYLDSRMQQAGVKKQPWNRYGGAAFGSLKSAGIVALALLGLSFIEARTVEQKMPALNRSWFVNKSREYNPFPHAVVAENLRAAFKLMADPEGAKRLTEHLKKRGRRADKWLEDIKRRRIIPLIRDASFRDLLGEKQAFRDAEKP